MPVRFVLLMALALLAGFVGYALIRIETIEPPREHVVKELKIPDRVLESDKYVPPSRTVTGRPPPR